MKTLIVFRGDYSTVANPKFICQNIKQNVIEPMKEKSIDVDVIFCTYPSDLNKLNTYASTLNPVQIYFTTNGQISNFKESMSKIKNIYDQYDYILFLRFDIFYKMNIMNFNIFDKDGIIFPYKEDSQHLFASETYYSDIVIIFSKSIFINVMDTLFDANMFDYQPFNTLHSIAKIVNKKYPDIKMHTMIDGYYQSNTELSADDIRLSPLFIQVKKPYFGKDRELYLSTM